MPREITLVGRTPVDRLALRQAAEAAVGSARVREADGVLDTRMDVVGRDGELLLSVYPAQPLHDLFELRRLLPERELCDGALGNPEVVQWMDAVAPWGASGELGVAIALSLAVYLDCACIVAD